MQEAVPTQMQVNGGKSSVTMIAIVLSKIFTAGRGPADWGFPYIWHARNTYLRLSYGLKQHQCMGMRNSDRQANAVRVVSSVTSCYSFRASRTGPALRKLRLAGAFCVVGVCLW